MAIDGFASEGWTICFGVLKFEQRVQRQHRCSGVDGYTVVFELVNNPEPGTNDEASFMIYLAAGVSNRKLQFLGKVDNRPC